MENILYARIVAKISGAFILSDSEKEALLVGIEKGVFSDSIIFELETLLNENDVFLKQYLENMLESTQQEGMFLFQGIRKLQKDEWDMEEHVLERQELEEIEQDINSLTYKSS